MSFVTSANCVKTTEKETEKCVGPVVTYYAAVCPALCKLNPNLTFYTENWHMRYS